VSGGASRVDSNEQPFLDAVEALYNTVRGIQTGVEVGATADKLFRQTNLLNTSAKDLVNAVRGGGSAEPFFTRVKNGTNNVQKTAQQLIEETQQ
jgi:hypothetical protein